MQNFSASSLSKPALPPPPKEIARLSVNAYNTYMISGNNKNRTIIDYEKISDTELSRLLKERMPEKKAPEVTDYNRQTMIGFLKFFSNETT